MSAAISAGVTVGSVRIFSGVIAESDVRPRIITRPGVAIAVGAVAGIWPVAVIGRSVAVIGISGINVSGTDRRSHVGGRDDWSHVSGADHHRRLGAGASGRRLGELRSWTGLLRRRLLANLGGALNHRGDDGARDSMLVQIKNVVGVGIVACAGVFNVSLENHGLHPRIG